MSAERGSPRPRDGPRAPAPGSSAVSPSAGNAILAKDIVDRHREKTLALLWQMALAFQVLRGGCRSRFLSVCPVKTTEITPASWAPLGPGRCGTCSATVPIAPAPRPASGVSSPPHRAQTRAQGHVGDGKRWEPGLRGPKSRDLDPPPWLPCHSPLKEEKDFHVRGLKITCDKAYDPKTFICLCVSGGDFS